MTVVINFPKTGEAHPVTDLNLTGKVSVPMAQIQPVSSFGNLGHSGTQYKGEVTWEDVTAAGNPVSHGANADFVSDKQYKATVTLTANEGFTFTDTVTFSHTDSIAIDQRNNTGGTIVVEIEFERISIVVAPWNQ
jgi:hypothetical protein